MRPVSRAESVLNEHVAEAREILRKSRIVLFFFGSESYVLDEHHFAGFEFFCRRSDLIIHDRIGRNEFHFLSEQFAQPLCHGSEAHLRHRLSLRSSEVRHEHCRGAVVHQIFYRRDSGPDARIVGDPVSVERNVEITSGDSCFACPADVFYRLFHFRSP